MAAGKDDEERIDLDEFFEEMISIIERRMRKQEAAIAKVESEIKDLKSGMQKLSGRGDLKIDKSVLKVLKQL
ncbi:MAG: hypothetical protein JXC85_01175 [Candidatus Aenigmarchaeota archaeon]|nr:hypothetical protein [Candidatus Aenigmarchaeota archaeon]